MLVRKSSSQISLCSPRGLIQDDTFRLYWIFERRRLPLKENSKKSENVVNNKPVPLHRIIWEDTLCNALNLVFPERDSYIQTSSVYLQSPLRANVSLVGDDHDGQVGFDPGSPVPPSHTAQIHTKVNYYLQNLNRLKRATSIYILSSYVSL